MLSFIHKKNKNLSDSFIPSKNVQEGKKLNRYISISFLLEMEEF